MSNSPVKCPRCGTLLKINPAKASGKLKCPKCGAPLVAGDLEHENAAPASAPARTAKRSVKKKKQAGGSGLWIGLAAFAAVVVIAALVFLWPKTQDAPVAEKPAGPPELPNADLASFLPESGKFSIVANARPKSFSETSAFKKILSPDMPLATNLLITGAVSQVGLFEEMTVVRMGDETALGMRFSSDVDASVLTVGSVQHSTHRDFHIYKTKPSAQMGAAGEGYSILANKRLLVTFSTLAALKAGIDRAVAGETKAHLGIPPAAHLMIRVNDVPYVDQFVTTMLGSGALPIPAQVSQFLPPADAPRPQWIAKTTAAQLAVTFSDKVVIDATVDTDAPETALEFKNAIDGLKTMLAMFFPSAESANNLQDLLSGKGNPEPQSGIQLTTSAEEKRLIAKAEFSDSVFDQFKTINNPPEISPVAEPTPSSRNTPATSPGSLAQ